MNTPTAAATSRRRLDPLADPIVATYIASVLRWLEAEAERTDADAPMNQGTPESGEAAGAARGFARGLRAAANVLTNGVPAPKPDKWAVGTRVLARQKIAARNNGRINPGIAGRVESHGYKASNKIGILWEGDGEWRSVIHRNDADDYLFVIPPEKEA